MRWSVVRKTSSSGTVRTSCPTSSWPSRAGTHSSSRIRMRQHRLLGQLEDSYRVLATDHEDALAAGGVLLVEHHDAGGNAGAVEEVGGQADDALEIPGADEPLADRGLRI